VRVPQRVLFIQQLIKAGITGGAPLEHCSSRKIAECLDVIRVNPRRIDRVGFKGQRRPGGIVVLIRERGNWPARKREGTGENFSA
jgi:hypothetical protein